MQWRHGSPPKRWTRRTASLLHELTARAEVEEAVVIGGSYPQPIGEYATAAQLLGAGVFEAFGLRRIGIAGYPRGTPPSRTC